MGNWVAVYQSAAIQGNPWVREDVHFKFSKGKLRFHTYNNEMKDEIEGYAEVFNHENIIGKWKQKDGKGANKGVFMLTIAPSGRTMFGFWSGTTDAGKNHYGGWVHAREINDLGNGKLLLKQMVVMD